MSQCVFFSLRKCRHVSFLCHLAGKNIPWFIIRYNKKMNIILWGFYYRPIIYLVARHKTSTQISKPSTDVKLLRCPIIWGIRFSVFLNLPVKAVTIRWEMRLELWNSSWEIKAVKTKYLKKFSQIEKLKVKKINIQVDPKHIWMRDKKQPHGLNRNYKGERIE